MKDRIKQARENAGFSQHRLAKELLISNSAISRFESGALNPSNRTIADIARICHVNEEWIRTGEGPMLPEELPHYDVESALNEIASEKNLSSLELNLVRAYLDTPEDKRKVIERMIFGAMEPVMDSKAKRDALHEALDEQFEAEEKGEAESSDFMPGSSDTA